MGALGRAITRWVMGTLVALILIGGLAAIAWVGLGLVGLQIPPGLYVLLTGGTVLLALTQGAASTHRPAAPPTPPRRARSENDELLDLLIRREARRRSRGEADGPDEPGDPRA